MRLQTIIIGILVVSALITGFYTFLVDLTGETGYDLDVSNDTAYESAYLKTKNLTAELESSYDKIEGVQKEGAAGFFTGLWEAVKIGKTLVIAPYSILMGDDGVINTLGKSTDEQGLEMPSWVTSLLFGFILALLIFAFIAILIKFKA